MALTRGLLKGLGIEADKIDQIIEAHSETVSGLKEERDSYREKAEAAETVIAERDNLVKENAALKKNAGDASKIQEAFDAYKADVQNRGKRNAVAAALKTAGVQREEFVDLLMGKVDMDSIKMTDDGSILDAAAMIAPLKTNYAGCFADVVITGTSPVNPVSGSTKNIDDMSDEEYYRETYGKTSGT